MFLSICSEPVDPTHESNLYQSTVSRVWASLTALLTAPVFGKLLETIAGAEPPPGPTKECLLCKLPVELIDHVFSFLDLPSRLRFMRASRNIRNHFLDNKAWNIIDVSPVSSNIALEGAEILLSKTLKEVARASVHKLVLDGEFNLTEPEHVKRIILVALQVLPNLEVLSVRGYTIDIIGEALSTFHESRSSSNNPAFKLRRINCASSFPSSQSWSATRIHGILSQLADPANKPIAIDILDCLWGPHTYNIPLVCCAGCNKFPDMCQQCYWLPNNDLRACDQCAYRGFCRNCDDKMILYEKKSCQCGTLIHCGLRVCGECSIKIDGALWDQNRGSRCRELHHVMPRWKKRGRT
ncbi:hypothetical protein BC937DRAFT_89289 [Endogone sp. FLAS-F59071]|nr:hypothetical protein BC937DRAFT_89289 [Endogone sp. FLAS-F59071]|eukprot:RUS17980.1 hypothetical protein BC937DRAFT_89289 [Endogone sp. FLAS-F59071]